MGFFEHGNKPPDSHKTGGISWPNERLLACQGGSCSMELFNISTQ